jgi:CD2 antigen cytoplasmic tail-binding protein 2
VADLPEGAQRAKQKGKRQLTGAEGYDSDSSNDEDGVVFSRRKDKGGKHGDGDGEDDDIDMFGAGSDDEGAKGTGKGADKGKEKGKEKDFMDLEDIVGQEELDERRRGGVYSDDEDGAASPGKDRQRSSRGDMDLDADGEDGSDEEAIEARRAAKRIATLDGDMGYELTGFNMKDEMEEGRFTADGETYVANAKDAGDKHDQWLTEVDDDAILKARRAHKEREKREAELEKEEADGVASEEGRKKEEGLMREAVALMERGETVLEALQRLGVEVEKKRKEEGKKKSWAERQKERKAHQDET